jgi:hypothetical protein
LHTSANATLLERFIQQRHRHSGIDKYKDIHVIQQRYRLSDIDKYKDIHFGVHDVSTRIAYIMYVHRPKIGKTNNMVAIKAKQTNNKTKTSKRNKNINNKKDNNKGSNHTIKNPLILYNYIN